jgi:hypothetical protein
MRGGVYGSGRVARHLWRMCFGLFIATGSFLVQKPVVAFMGGPKIFLLSVLPLILLVFWLIRIRFKNVIKQSRPPVQVALATAHARGDRAPLRQSFVKNPGTTGQHRRMVQE